MCRDSSGLEAPIGLHVPTLDPYVEGASDEVPTA
jgi:hypothetical protein